MAATMTARLLTRRWERTRRLVLERDGYVCRLELPGCTGRASHVDHVIPRRFGGSDTDLSNLRASCARCNTRRGDGTGTPPEAVVSAW